LHQIPHHSYLIGNNPKKDITPFISAIY